MTKKTSKSIQGKFINSKPAALKEQAITSSDVLNIKKQIEKIKLEQIKQLAKKKVW